MVKTEDGKRIIKLFTGAIITFIFVWMSFTTYRATEVIYTSELYPYTAVEAKDDLVIYVDKDITLKKLWGRAVDETDTNKVNFYDVFIIPKGNHTLTIDSQTLSGAVKSALVSKNLYINDGVKLEIISNGTGIECRGDLTVGKADVSIQCLDPGAYYGAFYVESTKVNFIESEIVEPEDAYQYLYTFYDRSTYSMVMKARIAPTGSNKETPAVSDKKDETKLTKAANPFTVQTKKVKIKASRVKKKKQTIKSAKYLAIKDARGIVTCKLTKVNRKKFRKYFKVNEENGNITVRKGLKKGNYKLTINVTAAGDGKYLPGTKSVTVTIKVR